MSSGLFSAFIHWCVSTFVNFQMKAGGLKFRELNTDNFFIRYWDSENQKPPLILMQAFSAEGKYSWRFQVWRLSRKYRLIVPNLLYFGGSYAKEPKYTIDEQIDALTDLLKKLSLEKVILCGASYSGIVAAEYAIQKPNAVNKLILLGSPLKYVSNEKRNLLYLKYKVKDRIDLLVPKDHEGFRKLGKLAYHRPPYIPTFILKSLFNHIYHPQMDERKKLLSVFDAEQTERDQKNYQFNCPVLIINGEYDELVPVETSEKLFQELGVNAGLKIIPDTAHLPCLEKPRIFNQIVLQFLDPKK
jgi:pimeloyl-ACP methyl ester carboxylesterase